MSKRPIKFSSIGRNLTEEVYLGYTYKTNKRKIDSIIVHCSDSPQGRGDDVHDIDRWHLQRWGSRSGVGYHYVILEDGTIQKGRWVDAIGSHVKGHNAHSIGICRIGGMDKDKNPLYDATLEQVKSIVALSALLKKMYRLEKKDILGHNEFPNVKKSCPLMDMDRIRDLLI